VGWYCLRALLTAASLPLASSSTTPHARPPARLYYRRARREAERLPPSRPPRAPGAWAAAEWWVGPALLQLSGAPCSATAAPRDCWVSAPGSRARRTRPPLTMFPLVAIDGRDVYAAPPFARLWKVSATVLIDALEASAAEGLSIEWSPSALRTGAPVRGRLKRSLPA